MWKSSFWSSFMGSSCCVRKKNNVCTVVTICSWAHWRAIFVLNYLVVLWLGKSTPKITLSWAHKPFITTDHTSFCMSVMRDTTFIPTAKPEYEGILPKGPYLPCASMAGRALLAGYHRIQGRCWPQNLHIISPSSGNLKKVYSGYLENIYSVSVLYLLIPMV